MLDSEGPVAHGRFVLVSANAKAHGRRGMRLVRSAEGRLQVPIPVDIGDDPRGHVWNIVKAKGIAHSIRATDRDRGGGVGEEIARAELRARRWNGCPAQIVGRVAHEAEGMAGIDPDDAYARGQAGRSPAFASRASSASSRGATLW